MNGVLGHDSALVPLYWAGNKHFCQANTHSDRKCPTFISHFHRITTLEFRCTCPMCKTISCCGKIQWLSLEVPVYLHLLSLLAILWFIHLMFFSMSWLSMLQTKRMSKITTGGGNHYHLSLSLSLSTSFYFSTFNHITKRQLQGKRVYLPVFCIYS